MKVLHIIDSGGLYGAEMMLLTLVEEQKNMGVIPILGSIGNKSVTEKAIEREAIGKGVTTWKIRMRDGPNFPGAYGILRSAKEEKIDLIHAHGYKGNILLGFMPKFVRNTPMVTTLHGWTGISLNSRVRYYEYLDRLSLRFIDRVVVVDGSMLENLPIELGGNRAKVIVIPNGIPDIDPEITDRALNEPILRFCNGGFIVASIGRLSPEKGQDVLVRAFRRLADQGIDAKLVILGEGPMRGPLERIIEDLRLEDKVLLAGFVENAKSHLGLFDLFVLPSFREGLPITVLEAMQAGTPILSTSVGGIPEVLDFGKAGILVDPGNSEQLGDGIVFMYRNPDVRKNFTERAREIVKSRYSGRNMAKQYLNLYGELVRSG